MGAGKVDGSLTPVVYMADGRQFFPFILWTYGTIEIQFAALSDAHPLTNWTCGASCVTGSMRCRTSPFLTRSSTSGPGPR